MYRLAVASFAMVALSACVNLDPLPPETDAAPAKCAANSADSRAASVVRVRSGATVCTGFAVDARTVVTAAHCVRDGAAMEVEGHVVERVSMSAVSDIAVLRMGPASKLSPLNLACYTADPGEAVELVGYGCTGQQQRRSMTVRSDSLYLGKQVEMLGCACPGDSGSPILNAAGEVVGVMSAGSAPEWFATDIALLDAARVSQPGSAE